MSAPCLWAGYTLQMFLPRRGSTQKWPATSETSLPSWPGWPSAQQIFIPFCRTMCTKVNCKHCSSCISRIYQLCEHSDSFCNSHLAFLSFNNSYCPSEKMEREREVVWGRRPHSKAQISFIRVTMSFVFPSHWCMWWNSTFLEILESLPAHGAYWMNSLLCIALLYFASLCFALLCLHAHLYLSYYIVFISVHKFCQFFSSNSLLHPSYVNEGVNELLCGFSCQLGLNHKVFKYPVCPTCVSSLIAHNFTA